MQKVTEISNVQTSVTDFLYFLQKVTEKVVDFRKFSAGIFPHSDGRLPPWLIGHFSEKTFIFLGNRLLNSRLRKIDFCNYF